MVWRTVTPSFTGDTQHFGGVDLNKIFNLFNGLLDVDSVDINSNFTFRTGKGKIRNPANTFSYSLASSAIVADRVLTLPLITGNDTVAVLGLGQTFTAAKAFDIYFDMKQITVPVSPTLTYHRLYVDSSDGHVKRKDSAGAVFDLESGGAGSGETNTMSNVGIGGVGVFKQKTGVNFEMKNVNAGSAYVTVTDDTGNNEIDIGISANVATLDTGQIFTVAKTFNSFSDIKEIAAPGIPSSTYHRLYVDTADGHVKRRSSGGTVFDLEAAGGGGGSAIVQPYDYFIYKSGSNYIALNGVTNTADFTNTSFYTVLTGVVSALTSGGKILLGSGDFSLTTKATITQNNISIEGMGVDKTRILYDMASTTLGGFAVNGSLSAAFTLTANSVKGSTTLTVADTTGIVAGDWIFCRRLIETTSGSTGRYDAEFHKVVSVTGTVVTIEDMMLEDFNTADTAALYKVTWVKSFELKNITMYENRGAGHNTNVDGGDTALTLCFEPHVENVKFEKGYFASLAVISCFDTNLTAVYFETPQELTASPGIIYGLYVNGASTNTTWNGGWGNRCRHTLTNNTNSGAVYYAGRQRNIMLTGVTSYNATTAHFDLHQAADGVSFSSCGAVMGHHGTVTTSAKGFNFRAPAMMVGCWTIGCTDNCVTIWNDDASAESGITPGGNRTIISGCKFQSQSLDEQGGNSRRGIRIQANRASVIITGCQFYDIADQPIYLEDGVSDVVISNCIFRNCGANLSTITGIIYATANVDNLVVSNNIFGSGTSPPNARSLYVVTSVDGLTFTGNNIRGMTSKVLNIPAISTDVVVKNNIGMNPLNSVTNHTNTTTNTIGFYGGTTATVVASTDYAIVGGDILLTATSGTGVSATIKDGAGNTVASGLTTPINAQYIPSGFKINFGGFSVAPTTTVFTT